MSSSQDQLNDVIAKAIRAGAQEADAVLVEGASLSVSWRGGKLESLEQSEGGDLGLRVLIGKKQASASTTDRSAGALADLVERVVAMAKAAPEDPYCGLAASEEIAKSFPEIEMADETELTAPHLTAMAREMEDAVLAVPGVRVCDGARLGGGRTRIALAASNGFSGAYTRTSYGLGASALAGEGLGMETDNDYATRVFFDDLPSAGLIGRRAGEKAVRRLGARKMPTCQAPVIFDPEESGGLLSAFVGAILGSGVARGTSFLKDKLGKQVFPKGVSIIDDPFRPRGHRSKAFDAEGLLPTRREIVQDGILTTWLMDLRSARQLGLKSTGHASRGTVGVPGPSPTNLFLQPGALTPEALIRDIKSGFYVTETMGAGINGVTGDYSVAARGFWIENGEMTFPVFEMTIAGNLKDMFQNLTPASDLDFRYGIDAPTVRVDGMTIAGA